MSILAFYTGFNVLFRDEVLYNLILKEDFTIFQVNSLNFFKIPGNFHNQGSTLRHFQFCMNPLNIGENFRIIPEF